MKPAPWQLRINSMGAIRELRRQILDIDVKLMELAESE